MNAGSFFLTVKREKEKKNMKNHVKARKNSLTPKAGAVISAFPAKTQVLIGSNITGSTVLFLGTVAEENICGFVTEAADDKGNPVDMGDFRSAIVNGYKAYATQLDGDPSGKTYIVEVDIEEAKAAAPADVSAELEAAIKAASAYCPIEEVRERVEYLKGNKIPDRIILLVLGQYRTYKKAVRRPSTLYVDLKAGTPEGILLRAICNMLTGNALDFIGDKSVGKNVCAETLAWVFNKPYYLITFSRQMTPDDVYGSKTTIPPELTKIGEEEAQKLALADIRVSLGIFQEESEMDDAARWRVLSATAAALTIKQEESELVNALDDGGVMVFNEMDMADANFFASFANQLTDGTGFIFIPGVGRQKISPDFTLIGTQNDNEAGAESQNRPTLSRFGGIRFAYPDSIKNQLKAATKGCRNLTSGYYDACEKLYDAFLKAVHAKTIDNGCLNIRGFVRALKLCSYSEHCVSLKSAIRDHVITLCKPADVPSLLHHLDRLVDEKL